MLMCGSSLSRKTGTRGRTIAVLCAGLMFGSSVVASAQAVYLRAQPVSSKTDTRQTGRLGEDTIERVYNRNKDLKITVTNMQTNHYEYEVQWQFLSKGVSDKKAHVYDEGAKTVALKGGESATFEVQSKPLQATAKQHYEYDDDGNLMPTDKERSGENPAGFVVLVKAGKQLLAVEASDSAVKKTYQKEIDDNRMKVKR
ncbi:MAG: hypothetical protein NTY53_14300 [Kiritimatiellaeota bacterium]|nr:hypothetical protein [Kiritimatiellota bacterium]